MTEPPCRANPSNASSPAPAPHSERDIRTAFATDDSLKLPERPALQTLIPHHLASADSAP